VSIQNDESDPRETLPTGFQRTVMRAFDLEPHSREVFLLCDVQGFTIREAAFVLGISRDTAEARLENARRDLSQLQQG
jgi:DNA-directed RNA polymerase specialized sigma24 family protein